VSYSQLHSSGGSEHEVNRRISISRNCIHVCRRIWRFMVSLSTKRRLYNVYIIPVFLYGAEMWSIIKRIDAFDQWCLRRILNITWSEHVTNSKSLGVLDSHCYQTLCGPDALNCFNFFGHVARADKSQDHSRDLQACISPAPINWMRRPGRPRHSWLRTMEEDLRQFNLGLTSGFGEHKTEQ